MKEEKCPVNRSTKEAWGNKVNSQLGCVENKYLGVKRIEEERKLQKARPKKEEKVKGNFGNQKKKNRNWA